MGTESRPLEVFFLPFLAPGHMIPLLDIARLFAMRGAKITVITTTLNVSTVQKTVEKDVKSGRQIGFQAFKLPAAEVGLPEGCENFYQTTTIELAQKLFLALTMLQQPIEQFFRETQPDCIVSDMFYPWTADIATELGIPRLVFHATCLFSLSVELSVKRHAPHEKVLSDTETFVVPGLPDPITMTRSQLPDHITERTHVTIANEKNRESELRSFGVVVNGFYELEPAYTHHYESMGSRVWHIGSASLIQRDAEDKVYRGNQAAIDEHECLSWLDSQKPNSVVFICFGSSCRFPAAQLLEIAYALEASGHPFIWAALGKDETSGLEEEAWLPEGFEERMTESKKGMIIRGWAPQVLILDHPAIGAFMTHCGYNSVLESVSAGVPMITWPLYAEHFYNEKLVLQVLKTGVPVGVLDWNKYTDTGNVIKKREKIEKAVTKLMSDEKEAVEIRRKAKEMGEIAKKAVKEGGSSYNNMTSLMEELHNLRQQKSNGKI